jgi:hypothetical protein
MSDGAFNSGNLPFSKRPSGDFVLGTNSKRQKRQKGVSAMKFELSNSQSADRPNFVVLGDMKRRKSADRVFIYR